MAYPTTIQPIYSFVKRVRVTSKWKQKVKQSDGSIKEHNGVDFGTVDLGKSGIKRDRSVFAKLMWECTNVSDLGELGWACKIYYPEIDETQYFVHLQEVIIKEGQKGKAGQTVAYTGVAKKQNTKKCPEHTHDQLRKGRETGGVYKVTIDGKSINPEGLIALCKLKSELPSATTPTPKPSCEVELEKTKKELSDTKDKLSTALSDHGVYVTKTTQTINDKDYEIGRLREVILEAKSVAGLLGEPDLEFPMYLESKLGGMNKQIEDAKKYDYRNIIIMVGEKIKAWLNKFKNG